MFKPFFAFIFILSDFPVENMQKNGTIPLLFIEYFFEHVIHFILQKQVETIFTRSVSHISEINLYNKIIYDRLI